MKRLRLFAALSVLTYAAFFPILFPTPASAALPTSYTLGEYNAAISAAQLAVANAQAVVDEKTRLLDTATATLALKTQAVVDGATAVAAAQANYDNNLIPQITASGAGLTAKVYNNTISRAPSESNLCVTTTVSQIYFQWGSGGILGCNGENVTVHFYGTITVPTTDTYRFRNIADDGFYMTINGQVVIDEWVDKGCNGAYGSQIQLTAGTAYTLDAWFYENSGGACSLLYYQTAANWGAVPAAWFGQTTTTTMVKDPALLLILQSAQASYATAVSEKEAAVAALATATEELRLANVALQAARDALAAIPPLTINAPSQLVASVDTSTVTLNWAAPNANLIPERYAISWTDGAGGWGIATGNAGDANALNTFISIDIAIIGSTGGWDKNYTFKIRSDHDSGHMYSAWSNEVVLSITNPTIPNPEPSSTPSPTAEPSPTQTSTPEPSPTPESSISPVPSQEPSPTPTPVAPVPSPEPTPEPTPAPSPEPSVQPNPTPQPSLEPSPVPYPTPSPEITPEPTPQPTPEPSPVPEPTPEPSPEPGPEPEPPVVIPDPEPSTDPATDTETPSEPTEEIPPAVEPEEPPVVDEGTPSEVEPPVEEEEQPVLPEPEPENPSTESLEPPSVEEKVNTLIENLNPGEALTADEIKAAGIEYKDLPPETPVEVRTDENGNEVIITAEVAAALVLLENPAELIGAIFSDPGQAVTALLSIGADMSTEEREESTKAVVATVIAAGAAINAVGAAAAGGSTGGSSTGGGGASGQSGYRRKP